MLFLEQPPGQKGFPHHKMALKGRKTTELIQKEIEDGFNLVKFASSGDLEAVRSLIENGVAVDADEYNRSLFYKSQNYMTPLMCAAKFGYDVCVDFLIDQGADLDAKDRFDVTALHLASENGHERCVRLLLDAGADCNIPTKFSKHGSYTAIPHIGGTTALHLATKGNHLTCIKELILNGSDYNAVDEQGRTSLYVATELGFEEAVLIHLRNAVGRDILSLPVKVSGETPLHECIRHGLVDGTKELLKHGSDVNYINAAGSSPLHLAVHNTDKFSFEIVKHLVQLGFNTDVNMLDKNGNTALHYVSFVGSFKQERRPQVAAFLIAYGANFVGIKNKQGMSLLKSELVGVFQDYAILQAMVKTMVKVPSLETLGITGHPRRNTKVEKCRWYRELASNPRSLQHNCRCAVRNAMGVNRLRHVRKLPLPTTLKDYLLLELEEDEFYQSFVP